MSQFTPCLLLVPVARGRGIARRGQLRKPEQVGAKVKHSIETLQSVAEWNDGGGTRAGVKLRETSRKSR